MNPPISPEPEPEFRVRAARTLVDNDGECAVVVLKGTPGTVGPDGVSKAPLTSELARDETDPDCYRIHVYWDMVVLNKAPDSDTIHLAWEMRETPVDALEFLEIRGD